MLEGDCKGLVPKRFTFFCFFRRERNRIHAKRTRDRRKRFMEESEKVGSPLMIILKDIYVFGFFSRKAWLWDYWPSVLDFERFLPALSIDFL